MNIQNIQIYIKLIYENCGEVYIPNNEGLVIAWLLVSFANFA